MTNKRMKEIQALGNRRHHERSQIDLGSLSRRILESGLVEDTLSIFKSST